MKYIKKNIILPVMMEKRINFILLPFVMLLLTFKVNQILRLKQHFIHLWE